MGDSGKPFACGLNGCPMTFSNQDHLEVHQKKHDMKLVIGGGLKSLDTPIIADQTPTPTRFLKNCEEVGLFNDLENPFDNEFSHAIDKEKSQKEVTPATSNQTTKARKPSLSTSTSVESATPVLIAPTVSRDTAKTVPVLKSPQVVVMSPTVSIAPAITSSTSVVTQIFPQGGGTGLIAGPILLRLPNGQTVPVAIPPPPSVADGTANVPNAIPVGGGDQPNILPSNALDPNGVKQRLKAALTLQNPQIVDSAKALQLSPTSPYEPSRKRKSMDDDGDERRQKFLERNRAAASRCRNKRKHYIQNLEKRAEDFQTTNTSLQNEVTVLRNEIAQLKQLLLAHKDCPITERQRKTQTQLLRGMQELSSESSQGVHRNSSTTPAEAASALAQLAQTTTS
ncbi:cyclic AMP-dependent transcription factor ATF-2-like isoform X2 [Anneissia japonica]|uniref:cyclic AMP-dependent transcription factor ATF-2-like isoform X2 n=1 Tax=Anneissia japonica TaxID=1529436 RepID=UPI0014255530|nr:cyclic AMP-dependent transcription factor ATF-2-like isoform X2 [Anneissia japonica]